MSTISLQQFNKTHSFFKWELAQGCITDSRREFEIVPARDGYEIYYNQLFKGRAQHFEDAHTDCLKILGVI